MLEPFQNQILAGHPFTLKNALTDVWSWTDLEQLLNLRPFINVKRFRYGKSFRDHGWNNDIWQSDPSCPPLALVEETIMNYSCHITDCSRINQKVNSICAELDNLLKHPTDAHVYFDLSFKAYGGIHYDTSYNLILQVEGQTHWRVWDIAGDSRNENVNVEHLDKDPVVDTILEPNDIVFIPAYFYHSGRSLTQRMSISFASKVGPPIFRAQNRRWLKLPLN